MSYEALNILKYIFLISKMLLHYKFKYLNYKIVHNISLYTFILPYYLQDYQIYHSKYRPIILKNVEYFYLHVKPCSLWLKRPSNRCSEQIHIICYLYTKTQKKKQPTINRKYRYQQENPICTNILVNEKSLEFRVLHTVHGIISCRNMLI